MPSYYCAECFSYCGGRSLVEHDAAVFDRLLTSGRVLNGWMDLLSGARDMNIPFRKCLQSYLSSEASSCRDQACPCVPGLCHEHGRASVVSCTLRTLIIAPVLNSNGIDFFSDNMTRVTRESYFETIELILLFLRGRQPGVIRPLHSLASLRRHGFLDPGQGGVG